MGEGVPAGGLGQSPRQPPEPVGRGPECSVLREVLDHARSGAGEFLCLEGEAGIGKTALLSWVTTEAAGFRVLRARPSPDFDGRAYSTVAELLYPLHGRGESFKAANAGVLHRLFDDEPQPEQSLQPAAVVDPLTMGAELLANFEELSEEAPLLVIVDDAHWLDASSGLALAFVANNLEDLAVAMLVATRREPASRWRDPDLRVLTLSGLSTEAAVELLAATASPAVARQLADATHGNPLAILGICEALTQDQRWGREPIRLVPERGAADGVFSGRLADLDADARLAVAVVACDDRLDPGVVAQVCGRLGADGQAGVAEAERLGLLRRESSRLALVHPLLRPEVDARLEPEVARAVHRAIADTLRRDGDLERRAWHLSRAVQGPDEEASRLLREAGDRSLARGDPGAAALSFLRAGELAVAEPETIDHLAAAGDAFGAAGQSAQAIAAFNRALESASDLTTRGALLVRRLIPLAELGADASFVDEMDAEVSAIADAAPQLAAALAVFTALPAFASGSLSRAGALLQRARSLAPELDPATELAARGLEAIVALFRGDAVAVRPVLLELAATPLLGEAPSYAGYVGNALQWADEFDAADELLGSMITTWRSRRAPGTFMYLLIVRAELRWRTGRFLEARADAEEATVLASASGRRLMSSYAMCALGRAEASLGRIAPARSLVEEAVREGGFVEELWGPAVLGFIALTDDAPAAAVVQLERAADFAAREQVRLMSPAPWGPDLVEAYVRAGRPADARALVARLADEAGSDPTAWSRGALRRCAGLVADDFDACFQDALTAQSALAIPFEIARTHLCFGERLRRDRRLGEAADQLRRAHDSFVSLGASRWAQRAERELASCGQSAESSRPPALAALTPKEYQVASLIATGATNRDAASSLFLSSRTVEAHLARVYRKLGINSRAQLVLEFAKEPRAQD